MAYINPNHTLNLVWDINTLQWIAMQQPLLKTDTLTVSVTNDGTFAKESGGHLAALDAKVPALGQAAMAASVPVALASDQPALVVIAL